MMVLVICVCVADLLFISRSNELSTRYVYSSTMSPRSMTFCPLITMPLAGGMEERRSLRSVSDLPLS